MLDKQVMTEDFTALLQLKSSDDGRLYGSVTTKDVCEVVNEKLGAEEIELSVTRSDVNFSNGIKAVGVYEIKIFIDGPVFATVLVNVCRSEKEAASNILAHGNKDSGSAAKVSDDVEATKLSHLSGKMKDRRRKVGHSAEVEAEAAEAKAKAKAEKAEAGVVSFTEEEESTAVEDVIENIADDSEEAKAVESLEAVEKAVEESTAEMESLESEVEAEEEAAAEEVSESVEKAL